MARLIVKSPYIKGGGAGSGGGPGGYLKYIGTREGVELLPSGFMEYMAERPRSHGLFCDEDSVDMDAVMKELNEYPGNIWTHVISLKREDAERLGYNHAPQWRNLIRAHRNDIASAMNISPQDFRWYAAFHDEGDHPQTVSKDNSLGSPQPPTFMLTQKISGIAGGATPSRAKK